MMRAMRKANRKSKITAPHTVRLRKDQIEDFKNLPDGVNPSVLVRALLDAYKDGVVILDGFIALEMARTERALESTHFQRGD
jgi:hypothetical protein